METPLSQNLGVAIPQALKN